MIINKQGTFRPFATSFAYTHLHFSNTPLVVPEKGPLNGCVCVCVYVCVCCPRRDEVSAQLASEFRLSASSRSSTNHGPPPPAAAAPHQLPATRSQSLSDHLERLDAYVITGVNYPQPAVDTTSCSGLRQPLRPTEGTVYL